VIEITSYIHQHPLRIIAGMVFVFALLLTLFVVQKKGTRKWLTLIALMCFIPIAFRVLKLTPFYGSNGFQSWNGAENTDDSSYELNGIRTFGLDISYHQGSILWDSVAKSKHPIQFVFIRACYGATKLDAQFHRNWEECSGKSFLRGAYHYYRPSQNSNSQFDLFKTHVYLRKGDLPPMLDIEENSLLGRENLLRGVKNWLKLAEDHYGIKPIIYTNLDFYRRYFDSKEFKSYHFWIAAYSGRHRIASVPWTFHQFSEKMRVKGISELVDGNDFNGDRRALERLCIK
jgi:GH25 family lysozyme M1 (1,4-beta-N-acetylmuramidase)